MDKELNQEYKKFYNKTFEAQRIELIKECKKLFESIFIESKINKFLNWLNELNKLNL